MDNEKLKEIKNNLTLLPVLQERAEKIQNRVYEAEDNVISLMRKFDSESLDVEQLKKDSLSTTLLKLIGRYEGKLDKESREMLTAKMEYDKACEREKELRTEQFEILKRISALKEQKQTYEDEFKRREQIILGRMNDEISIQYKQLEKEREILSRQLIEMDEAIQAAHRAKNTAQSAMQHLDSAEDWATYDIWLKGGFFSHAAKYDHIDNAQSDFNRLNSQLKDLQKELSDINISDIPESIGISSTTRAIDFWFDNIFTDMNVRDQIREDIDQIRTICGKIEGIISYIENKKSEISITLKDIERRKNELIITL